MVISNNSRVPGTAVTTSSEEKLPEMKYSVEKIISSECESRELTTYLLQRHQSVFQDCNWMQRIQSWCWSSLWSCSPSCIWVCRCSSGRSTRDRSVLTRRAGHRRGGQQSKLFLNCCRESQHLSAWDREIHYWSSVTSGRRRESVSRRARPCLHWGNASRARLGWEQSFSAQILKYLSIKSAAWEREGLLQTESGNEIESHEIISKKFHEVSLRIFSKYITDRSDTWYRIIDTNS